MRNIIFISVILAGTPGLADDIPVGCFQRTYSVEHLNKTPQQTVAELTISFEALSNRHPVTEDGFDWPIALVEALIASTPQTEQGALAGRRMSETLLCSTPRVHKRNPDWVRAGMVQCNVECDGGGFWVMSADNDEIVIRTRTDGIRLGDGCGGDPDLQFDMKDETAGATTYRLFSVPADMCTGLDG